MKNDSCSVIIELLANIEANLELILIRLNAEGTGKIPDSIRAQSVAELNALRLARKAEILSQILPEEFAPSGEAEER